MSALAFNFGNALNHVFRTEGPKGFLWKFALLFALLSFGLQAIGIFINWPVYQLYIEMFTVGRGDIEPYMDELTELSNRSSLGSFLLMPFSVMLWVVFEAASQRRYMRGEGFRLRLSADEGRLLVVGVIWFALLMAAYIGVFVLLIIPIALIALLGPGSTSTAVIGAIVAMVLVLLYMLVVLYFVARFSPAAAMTVRDQKIRFFEAWGATKGRFWPLFGSWFVMALGVLVVFGIAYSVIAGLAYSQIGPLMPDIQEGSSDASAVFAVMSQPAFWGPIVVLLLALMIVQGAMQHIFAGPPALAAKTDPRWVGRPNVGEEFI